MPLTEPPNEHAHLFTCCIECKRVEWTTIGEQYVPVSLVPGQEKHEAAFLMVACGCMLHKAALSFDLDSWDRCNNTFKGMRMNKEMMEETKAYQAANMIAGKKVQVIGFKTELVYVQMDLVMKALTPADTMVRLDLGFVDSGDMSRMELKGLKQGLI